ncbi:unnamed protein product [Amoebophrya sp. A25]|nr:unnamed protein product [Amoebophrya sp. A25]|eukprot:GSA25T00003453001.1
MPAAGEGKKPMKAASSKKKAENKETTSGGATEEPSSSTAAPPAAAKSMKRSAADTTGDEASGEQAAAGPAPKQAKAAGQKKSSTKKKSENKGGAKAGPKTAASKKSGNANASASSSSVNTGGAPGGESDNSAKLELPVGEHPEEEVEDDDAHDKSAKSAVPDGIDPKSLGIPLDWVRIKAEGGIKAEDTYEMSSEAENSDHSPDRANKTIPKWCENWVKVMESQSKIDPDTVFGFNMKRVDLPEVFPNSTKLQQQQQAAAAGTGDETDGASNKRARRQSVDGDPARRWVRDKLRKEEVLNYTRVMGQTTRLEHLWKQPTPSDSKKSAK